MDLRRAAVIAGAVSSLFLTACGALPTDPQGIAAPKCTNAAPLLGADHRANPDRVTDEYLVLLRTGTDVPAEAARLASKHRFAVKETFWITPSFAADLDPETVAELRCEPVVQSIQFSQTNIPPP